MSSYRLNNILVLWKEGEEKKISFSLARNSETGITRPPDKKYSWTDEGEEFNVWWWGEVVNDDEEIKLFIRHFMQAYRHDSQD